MTTTTESDREKNQTPLVARVLGLLSPLQGSRGHVAEAHRGRDQTRLNDKSTSIPVRSSSRIGRSKRPTADGPPLLPSLCIVDVACSRSERVETLESKLVTTSSTPRGAAPPTGGDCRGEVELLGFLVSKHELACGTCCAEREGK